ncbi:MAG TPA: chorismate mutase [Streptosporangiaceae bacterium]|nr:chorismate mutase [Streptosporangiaceae bacterium]
MPEQVTIGSRAIGDSSAVVVAGPRAAADITWVSLRRHHGAVDAAAELSRHARPLIVEPFSAADLGAIAEFADAVLVGAAWMQDFRLLRAAARTGLPVVIQRGPAATLDEWLSAAEYCVAEGDHDIVLCETGSRTHLPHPAIDLAMLGAARRRSGRPVLVDVSSQPGLAVAALAAGADGLLLGEDATAELAAEVRDRAAVLGPLVGEEDTATLRSARAAIDRVDAALATLLERRAALAGIIQGLKPVGGFAGRDPERERQVVAAMATRAPRLGHDRLARIMTAVIESGLEVAEGEAAAAAALHRSTA